MDPWNFTKGCCFPFFGARSLMWAIPDPCFLLTLYFKNKQKQRLIILKQDNVIWKVSSLGIQPYKRFHMSFRLQSACHFFPTKIKKPLQNDVSRTVGTCLSFHQKMTTPTKNFPPSKSQFLFFGTPFWKPPVFWFPFHASFPCVTS